MKKIIGLLLALCMTFTMFIGVGAYSDVEQNTYSSEAITILSNLGVFDGFEDGSFKPNDTVTRAQMAKIICQTLGYGEQAEASAGSTIFTDVPANHWASGYINVAQSLDIINGYGNGNFGPEDKVTYEQAVKMIVSALGYNLVADAKGGYPTGYLAVASTEGIVKGSNGKVGTEATRSTIAVLVYNALEVRLMDQETWTSDGSDEFGKTNDTILSKYLGVQKWEGVVTSTPYVDYAKDGYSEDAETMITLEKAFYTEYVNGKSTKIEDEVMADCSFIANINDYLGKKVVAYIGEDEDDATGNRMVYAIAEKQGSNKVISISASQLVEEGNKYYDENGVVGYINIGSTRANSLDIDEDVIVIKNYENIDAINSTVDLIDYNGVINFISNDTDSDIEVIMIIDSENEDAVVENIDIDDEIISFDCYTGYIEDYDLEDEDYLAVVVKDGKYATINDIAKNDTVSKIVDTNSFVMYYVSSKVIRGSVDTYDDETVEIDGNEYLVGGDYDTAAELSGKEGIFFVNFEGKIVYDDAEATRGKYGIILAAGSTSGINRGYELEILLADGKVDNYLISSKAYIEDETDKNDAEVYDTLIESMTEDDGAYRITAEAIDDVVYEVTIKNDKVTKLVKLDGESTYGKEYDSENLSYGKFAFDKNTVVVSVDATGEEFVEADNVVIGNVSNFFVDGEGEDAKIYGYDENYRDVVGFVIGLGLVNTIPQDGDALVITSVRHITYDDDEALSITGLQGGRVVTYILYDENEVFSKDELKKGNVILTAVPNSDKVIKNYTLLYDVEEGIAVEDNEAKEEYYLAGQVISATDSKFEIEGIEEAISMKSSANYTLVDYEDSTTDPEVSKKSKGKSIFGSLNKYVSTVFVRYYDDELVEVIVYRNLID